MTFALLFSAFASYLLLRFNSVHQHLSGDYDLTGPQKFHTSITPRIGGISIYLSFLTTLYIFKLDDNSPYFREHLILCSIPVFGIGLIEDIHKHIYVRTRILITAMSALIAILLLGVNITTVDIKIFDWFLSYPWIAILFTIFAVTGLTNSYNIIDGFHGLSSMTAIITLLALSYVSHINGDYQLSALCLTLAASIGGFFIFNFPHGLIFLGDGGAYLIGFMIAELSILLSNRQPEISPWFIFLVNLYPITETIFSIYRRFKRKLSPGMPDGIHFHTLIYRRIVKHKFHTEHTSQALSPNAKTSPYLWVLTLLAVLPAVCFWKSTPTLVFFSCSFVFLYVWLYLCIIHYKTPRWLSFANSKK